MTEHQTDSPVTESGSLVFRTEFKPAIQESKFETATLSDSAGEPLADVAFRKKSGAGRTGAGKKAKEQADYNQYRSIASRIVEQFELLNGLTEEELQSVYSGPAVEIEDALVKLSKLAYGVEDSLKKIVVSFRLQLNNRVWTPGVVEFGLRAAKEVRGAYHVNETLVRDVRAIAKECGLELSRGVLTDTGAIRRYRLVPDDGKTSSE